MNLKISYKVWKDCTVFVNNRNLLYDHKRELAFLDDVPGLYMVGLDLHF